MRITAAGKYKLQNHSYPTSVVYVSGDIGGATASLQHKSDIPLLDGDLEIGTQYRVDHGSKADIYVVVVGTPTNLVIDVHGLN